ncbi:hypothetical protein [Enterococcus sp. HY326]|uniref:hypothetical protein n=1 Tax=Enterococcus sp. HY326 TaxID=2971265 RepID=UPI00223F3BE8|nr:hypothetical protein [Enterococcus sp. HY326]
MKQFKIGDGVTPLDGPFKGIYGVVVFYDEKEQVLVRFTGSQQLYFAEMDLRLWEN